MSPNDPRVQLRASILTMCGYKPCNNGVHYSKRSDIGEWTYITSFPYTVFHAVDKDGKVCDAWVQEYPGDAR